MFTIPLIAMGGRGVIAVTSNEIPAEMTQMTQAALAGDFARARAIQRKYQPLMEVNFVEIQSDSDQSRHGDDGTCASRCGDCR